MPSLRQLSIKLQTALCQKGWHIKINQFQSYSEKAERMVTKFVLQETKQNNAGKVKTATPLETYQLAEIVKRLAAI